jgi:hypothetical protein
MLAREAPYILEEAPDLFVRQLTGKPDHAGTGRSVLDHPEDFTFRAMAPESMVPEITRRRIQLGCQRPIPVSVFPVTVEAAALAVIEGFTLLNNLRGTRQRAYECTRLGQFVGRYHRLHHVTFSSGWEGKESHHS